MLIDFHTDKYIEYIPRNFRVGEIVTCIKSVPNYMTEGREYEVILYEQGNIYNKNYMRVKPLKIVDRYCDESVISQWWNDDHFQSISNIRNEKIEEILY